MGHCLYAYLIEPHFYGSRCFSSSGEASNPEEYTWLSSCAGYKPIIEYCGGTEIGGGFLSGCVLQPQAASTFSTPTVGSEIVVLDETNCEPLGPSLRGLSDQPQVFTSSHICYGGK